MIKTFLPSLQGLTKATSNALQCIHSRVQKKDIPKIFDHSITSNGIRDRITQELVNNSALSLLSNMNKCHEYFYQSFIGQIIIHP